MNNWTKTYTKLLVDHEALLSRLFIRNFFIQHMISEVYENVGQSLAVVRMHLATFNLNNNEDSVANIHFSGNLVQHSIRDLRIICKSFYPDEDILNEEGFIEGCKSIIEILFQTTDAVIKTKGEKKEMQHELKLIVFKIMLEILVAVKEAEGEFVSLVISHEKKEVKYLISYKGTALAPGEETEGNESDASLSMQQRAELINAKYNITQSKAGITRIELMSPLKSVFYE